MARLTELHAEGISSLTRVAKELGPEVSKRWKVELRKAAEPIAGDAQRRYRGLNRLGGRAAKTVGRRVSAKGLEVRAGGQPWSLAEEFGSNRVKTRTHDVRNAFGKGVSLIGIEKNINYKTLFGTWTGNRHTLRGTGLVAGHALFPAAAAGRDEAITRLEKVRDEFVKVLGEAGD